MIWGAPLGWEPAHQAWCGTTAPERVSRWGAPGARRDRPHCPVAVADGSPGNDLVSPRRP